MTAWMERGGQRRLCPGWYTLRRFVVIDKFMGSLERNTEREVNGKQGEWVGGEEGSREGRGGRVT